jgi:hypothetical protein
MFGLRLGGGTGDGVAALLVGDRIGVMAGAEFCRITEAVAGMALEVGVDTVGEMVVAIAPKTNPGMPPVDGP